MKIDIWPINRPIPYARNARKIPASAVDKVAASVKEFGWRQPIVVDDDGVIIAGHTRLLAAQKLELGEVPVHVAAGLSVAQVKALRIMDNRSHQEATWDMELLVPEFAELEAMSVDLLVTGFDAAEIDRILGVPDVIPSVGTDADAVPDVPIDPTTRTGDVWALGDHRVMCGDCRDYGDISRLFGNVKANLVFTSPPYASQREYDQSSGFKPIQPDEYVEWYRDVAGNVQTVIADDGSYFLNIKPSADGLDTYLYVFDLIIAHVREWRWHFATEFCWERNGVPKSVTQRFKNQFEPVYQFAMNRWKMRPDDVRHASDNVPVAGGLGSGDTGWGAKQGGTGSSSVSGSFGAAKKRKNGVNGCSMDEVQGTNWQPGEYIGPGMAYPGNRLPTFVNSHTATGHTAAFPVGLPDFFIRAYTDAGDVVFDPFMGSGSTLIAAEQTGRKGMGTEISPKYIDVIVKRWQEFTGKAATLDGDGRTFAEIAASRA
jgi:DNA modification methylase